MEDQDELIIRKFKLDSEDVALEANNKATLEDVGYKADLCVTNQKDNIQN